MPFEKFDILKGRLRNYCNVNSYDLDALKANLEEDGVEDMRDIFQSELDEVIAGVALPRAEYEKLTDEEFEDDAAYKDNLIEIRGFLFEGAPHP